MAGPSPRDEYSPTPSVNPTGGAPNDYLQVRANPNSFGAQVGEAGQKLGQTVTQTGTQAVDVAAQYQGVLNEAAANAADLQLATKGGEVYSQYKLKEGFDAVNSKDQAVKDYTAVHQAIRSQLNPAAARSYDQLANRRISYTIADMNDYAAQQTKAGVKSGIQASKQLSIDQASRISVAGSDQQFDYELGSLKYNLANELTNPAAGGPLAGVPATTNKDGTLTFDQSIQQGKTAQAVYDNELNQETGKIWGTRLQTLANDTTGKYSVLDAVKVMNDNKDRMPASTYAEWSQKLLNPLRSEQARGDVDGLLSDAHADYTNGGKDISGAFIQQESSGGKTSTNLGQIQPETWKTFSKPGEDINNPVDNSAVTKRILDKYSSDYHGDVSRMAVAYFSGPGNVAPPGSPTPWIKDVTDASGKTVSGYVSDIQSKTQPSPGKYQTPVDYVSLHEPELIQKSRDVAKSRGFDVTVQDLYAQRMETRINEMRSAQTGEVRALTDGIIGRVTDEKAPMTNMTFLDNSQDPQVRSDWLQLQALNPYARQTVENIVAAQAKGKSTTYGTDFYTHLQSVLNGQVTDPVSLANYIGGDKSPVSSSGFGALQKQARDIQTPQGQAFAQDEMVFFKKMHDLTTGANVQPGVRNAAGETRMNTFLQTALPAIEAARAQGKTSADLFDDKSPDYIGKFMKVPPTTTLFKELFGNLGTSSGPPPASPASYGSLSDLQKAVKNKTLTRQAAEKLALQNKWIQPNPPSVPLPE